jgi:hypothetical protein
MKFRTKKCIESDNLSRHGDYSLALTGDGEIKANGQRYKSFHSKRIYRKRFEEYDDGIQDSLHLARERLLKEEYQQEDEVPSSIKASLLEGREVSTKNVEYLNPASKRNKNIASALVADREVSLNRAKAA